MQRSIKAWFLMIASIAVLHACGGGGGAPGGSYTVSGTVSGLTGSGLVLQNNGVDDLNVMANGSFTFTGAIANGGTYNVAVRTQPSGQACTVNNGSGVIGGANITNVTVACSANTYSIGGTVSGLSGSGLVLQNNGGDDLALSVNGPFLFASAVADGAGFAVTVKSQPSGPAQTCTVGSNTGSVTGANVTNISVVCSTNAYAVGGAVSGLNGAGLVLQNNGTDDLNVDAAGSFTFAALVASGAGYSVTVKTQPAGQACTITNGSGVVGTSAVGNVAVSCSDAPKHTIGGTVSGLAGVGLVLRNNGGDDLNINASGGFTFGTSLSEGLTYQVTVKTNPSGQTCTVNNGSGIVPAANVTAITVTCTANALPVGGTVSGLSGGTLVLRNNGTDELSITGNGTFAFNAEVANGAGYAVTVQTQPTGQTCSVTHGSGIVSDVAVTTVAVTCAATGYTLGGTVSGLTGTVVLRNNGGDDKTLSANVGFTFATPLANGTAYSVTVQTEPSGQTCQVTNGSGVISGANVTSILVTCTDAPTYTVGGTVSGLTGTLVLQDNGADDRALSSSGTFTFSAPLASGATYSVTVKTHPSGQICSIANGSGTIGGANITDIAVTCAGSPGTLDSTFNGTGILSHNNAAGGNYDDQGNAIVIDGNGKILVAGQSSRSSTNLDMALWRYTAGGTLDTTFNGSGFVVSNGAAGGNGYDAGNGIAIDGNGKILVAGCSTNAAGNYDMVLWRYNDDGTPDTTFNGTGIVVSNGAAGGNSYDAGYGIAIDANGKILVTGYSYNASNNMDMTIWRYNADGTPDTAFNGTGIAVHNSAAGGTWSDYGAAVKVDGNGKILVTGYSAAAPLNNEMAIWRYNANGSVDTSFNGTGFVINSDVAGGNGNDSGSSLAIDTTGNIVVAGLSRNAAGNDDLVVWRYTDSGSLDTTFNSTGFLIRNNLAGGSNFDYGTSVAMDSGGKIVVVGNSMNNSGNSDAVLMRLKNDGTPDTNFNGTGIVITNNAAGGNGNDYGLGVTMDGNGKILMVGASRNGAGNLDMVVLRFNP